MQNECILSAVPLTDFTPVAWDAYNDILTITPQILQT